MDIVELFIDENDEVSGIEAISVVENPAIEENFIALKNQEFKLAEVDKEKRILMGAALIPNKPIYRQSGEQEYYIYFSQATVRKASELFFIKGNQNNSTLEHQLELKGLTAVESWIVESEQDKSRMYDLNVPIGTWMVSMKVNNDDVWKKVKAGDIKGFSIEGYFADRLQRPNEPVKDDLKEPCWEGYEMIGFKIKNGKRVPNCVPIKQSKMNKEEIAEAKIEELKQLFSTQKVKLSIIQDALQNADRLDDISQEILLMKKDVLSTIRRIESDMTDGRERFQSLRSQTREIKQMSKDLGIDIPKLKIVEKSLQKWDQAVKFKI
jgi:hypothetical protein